ncbi:site-specific integrase, partial [Devosia sp. A449]
PWQAEIASSTDAQVARIMGSANARQAASGKSLADCRAAYAAERIRTNKPATGKQLDDMDKTIGLFQALAGVSDVGLVQRRHIISFRDQMYDSGRYATASVNKRTGYITTLVKTAANKGWIDGAIRGDIRLTVPDGEDAREPYSNSDLHTIFGHPLFTKRQIPTSATALDGLPFWLPLISCLHGMISSEILQLGPDTIRSYPGTDILCFVVTTSGGRHTKTVARRRWLPIRQELIDLGFNELVEAARAGGWSTLWRPVADKHGDIDAVSQQVSSFWADFARSELKISDPQKTLYSFRHSFKDATASVGATEDEKKQLLGHAETGATKGYGTKKEPRPVDIRRLNDIVQAVEWDFLEGLARAGNWTGNGNRIS